MTMESPVVRTVTEITFEFEREPPPIEMQLLYELKEALECDGTIDEGEIASLAIRLRVEAIETKFLGLGAERSSAIIEIGRKIEELYGKKKISDEDYLRYLDKLKVSCAELEA